MGPRTTSAPYELRATSPIDSKRFPFSLNLRESVRFEALDKKMFFPCPKLYSRTNVNRSGEESYLVERDG